MEMVSRKSLVGLVVVVLATSCLGLAFWGHKSSDERAANVTFASMSKFKNGVTLPAGTYRMEVADNARMPKVTFSQNGNVMATVRAKVMKETAKNQHTEVDSVTRGKAQLVTTIRPSGWEEALIFASAKKHGSA